MTKRMKEELIRYGYCSTRKYLYRVREINPVNFIVERLDRIYSGTTGYYSEWEYICNYNEVKA